MSILLRRIAASLLAVCAVLQIGSTQTVRASSSGVVISQVYGGGGNSGATYTNDFIELFNAGSTAVNLSTWSVQYGSSSGTSWSTTVLSGTIQPGQYYLVQEARGAGGTVPLPTPDSTGAIALSATAGKVALVNNSTALSGACPTSGGIVDLVGFGGANCSEGTPTAVLSNTTAALRAASGCFDTDNNATNFSVGPPTPRNSGSPAVVCSAPTNPSISASSISVLQGDPVLLTVTVTPGANPPSTGLVVTGDLSAVGGLATQAFFDDGTHGDITPGDRVYSFRAPPIAAPSSFSFLMSASDAQLRTATPATLQLTVAALTAIHDIQGPGGTSPLVGQRVTTRGIVTGVKVTGSKGFFIEAPVNQWDTDPNTSEGVFVYTGSNPPPEAVAGNLVTVTANVQEYVPSGDPYSPPTTELSGSPSVTVVSTGNELPPAITLTATDLNAAPGIDKLEKYEGMRVHVDQLVTTEPTGGTLAESAATSKSDGLFVGVLPGKGRPFREAGIEPPDPVPTEAISPSTVPIWDGNPERIAVATGAFATSSPLDVTSGVVLNDITGPLDYVYRMYAIDTDVPPVRASDDMTVQSVRPRTSDEFTVATMNLARFFDSTDDPGVSDVALTPTAFGMRLAKASMAILNVMQAPDIIGVEEMENLPTLQALANKVFSDSLGAVDYAAYLMEGNDIGGIDVGFLVRKEKVTVNTVEQLGKGTPFNEPDGTTSKLNDRPSLILHGAILNTPYDPYPVTVVVNHLKAMSGIDGASGARNRAKRLAQTVELAGKLQALQADGEAVISVGDYNAFEFNDGYTDMIGLLTGTEVPAEQVTLWAPSPVTPPLFDIVDLAPADQRYSYVYDGNAQEIDHILVSSLIHPNAVGYGRMNADFPESLRGDATRPERLSDHDPIVGYFSLPDIDRTKPTLTVPASIRIEGNAFGGATVIFQASAFDTVDGNLPAVCSPASGALFHLGTTIVSCTAVDAHGNVASGSFDVTVTDTTAPTINAVTPSTPTLWPANHTMTAVTIAASVTDVVDPAPACRVTSVTGDDGANVNDSQIIGPLAVSLRAERLGGGSGRTYTIAVTCVDGSGNTSAARTTTVFVPHDQRK